MVGRSLLSVLAGAAVAIQACVASALSPGKHSITVGRLSLNAIDAVAGSPLTLDPSNLPGTTWFVEEVNYVHNYNYQIVVIRLDYPGKDLWVAPLAKVNHAVVELQSVPFNWRLDRLRDGRFTISPAFQGHSETLVLAESRDDVFPPKVEITDKENGDPLQIWAITPVKEDEEDEEEEFVPRCGPRRIQRGSFYHQ
ncbi:hypothetical protein B0O80DRAFT_466727 [Mortierella sp. GBAus27b]|nr:hypothetical protein BGX31_000214 [Mortierella sp. GBA43]KAI8346792.1 hypothetical protein B0O80DRAFT_466727 [Mortierella sp. GBAus27b]